MEIKIPSLVILDDLMFENPKTISKIFTIYSHHRNYTVIETVQNLFHKSHRDITLNAQFVVLFKNCRDLNQIKHFARQAFPDRYQSVMNAYKKATTGPRGYILFDFRCEQHQDFWIRSAVFPGEVNYVYQ